MTKPASWMIAAGVAATLLWAASAGAEPPVESPAAVDAFAQQASWRLPTVADVRKDMLAWLDGQKLDPATRRAAEALWPENEETQPVRPSQPAGENAPAIERPPAVERRPAVENRPAGDNAPAAENPSGGESQPGEAVPQPGASRQRDEAQPPADKRRAEESRSGESLLVRVAATFAVADPRAKEVIELCRRERSAIAAPDFAWLADPSTPLFERANLRLLYGRWLAHERMIDEALAQLEGLQPDDVVDPAGLLFYQGVVGHRLLKQDFAVTAIKRLLERSGDAPRRYVSISRLMLADLKGLEDESLDHIARRMQDIERRLDLGRAGPKVRDVEDGVIRSLDKMIDEMEKQRQRAMAGAGGAGNIRSAMPAPDSRILGGKGPGQVDNKNIGHGTGWGDLPPKQRQEALQQIGKDYPAHYRDLIEQYFRKLASEGEPIEP